MICQHCGGEVEWKGPLVDLTHTECLSCGAMNSQIQEVEEDDEDDDCDDRLTNDTTQG